MVTSISSFRDYLSGEQAFYAQENYIQITQQELGIEESLPVIAYEVELESKIIRVVKQILATFFVLPLVHQFCHFVAGLIILPATFKSPTELTELRVALPIQDGEWRFKRLSIQVDGYQVDAMIMGRESTLSNGRWMLYSNGNGDCYERVAADLDMQRVLKGIEGNVLFFNYPSVGASSGFPNRDALLKSYRAMLMFLEDQERGIGANQIIGYGLSLGGGIQGEVLRDYPLNPDIDYLFIKDRTFADLSNLASELLGSIAGLLVKILSWNLNTIESSRQLTAPEIVLQSVDHIEGDRFIFRDDEVIPATQSLAFSLWPNEYCTSNPPKKCRPLRGNHCAPIPTAHLIQTIPPLLPKRQRV